MLCFPQLSTGAIAQLPLKKTIQRRTVANIMPGGEIIKSPDPDAYGVEWDLRYQGLTDEERTALEAFFEETSGRLRSFIFLDPTANLLVWSGDLTNETWPRDGMIQLTSGTADPDGVTDAFRIVNTGQVSQGLRQTVAVPATLQYAFSLYVRAENPVDVTLSIAASDVLSTTATASPRWQRLICTGRLPGDAEEIRCGVEIAAGGVVDVFGPQLEAQPMPSAYRRTAQVGGVFSSTRFVEDRITFTAEGIDDHSVRIRLTSHVGA